jgi:hypothetical protein
LGGKRKEGKQSVGRQMIRDENKDG